MVDIQKYHKVTIAANKNPKTASNIAKTNNQFFLPIKARKLTQPKFKIININKIISNIILTTPFLI